MWPRPWRRREVLRGLSPKVSPLMTIHLLQNRKKIEQKPLQEVKAAVLIVFLLPLGY